MRADKNMKVGGLQTTVRGSLDIYRLPHLAGNMAWSLTKAAREDLFRPKEEKPKPHEPPPSDDAKPLRDDLPRRPSVGKSDVPAEPPASTKPPTPAPAEPPRPRMPEHQRTAPVPLEPADGDSMPPEMLNEEGFFGGMFGGGRHRSKPFDWIRFNNNEQARSLRRGISAQTRQAAGYGGYNRAGRLVRIEKVKQMIEGTVRLAPSLENCNPPRRGGSEMNTEVTRHSGLVLDAALELRERYRNSVGIVSAASGYHCGGGFLGGGRHALEEALCVQTTLFGSLAKVEQQVLDDHNTKEASLGDGGDLLYIPEDGVILSPLVEVFRGGSDQGYPFMEKPALLACCISLGMFNKNRSMSDAPVDAPENPAEYRKAVAAKFRSMFVGALQARCSALVVPDVGCGVYQNDPEEVGSVLGEVLRQEFWCHFKEVAVVGKQEFQAAVVGKVNEIEASERAAKEAARRGNDAGGGGFAMPEDTGRAGAAAAPAPEPRPEPRRHSPRPEPRPEPRRHSPPASPRPPPSFAPPAAPTMCQAQCPSCGAGNTFAATGGLVTLECGRCGTQFQAMSPPPAAASAAPLPAPSPPREPPKPSPAPAPPSGYGGDSREQLCKFGCGRPVKPGFSTCCKACGISRGSGAHDADCAFGFAAAPHASQDDRRNPAANYSDQRNPARSHSPPPPAPRLPCKFGCGRLAAPGTTRSGRPMDTCCRTCAMSRGAGGHSPECAG